MYTTRLSLKSNPRSSRLSIPHDLSFFPVLYQVYGDSLMMNTILPLSTEPTMMFAVQGFTIVDFPRSMYFSSLCSSSTCPSCYVRPLVQVPVLDKFFSIVAAALFLASSTSRGTTCINSYFFSSHTQQSLKWFLVVVDLLAESLTFFRSGTRYVLSSFCKESPAEQD